MKSILLAFSMLLALNAMAETELTCWNKFAPRGSRPILKAKIVQQNTLDQVTLDLKDGMFSSYFEESTVDSGERYGHRPSITKSFIQNPKGVQTPALITTNRSPYKGNSEYRFVLGHYSFNAPYIQQDWDYTARLILPVDLTNANLRAAQGQMGQSPKTNAVMIYSPAESMHQGGDNYLRMNCISK